MANRQNVIMLNGNRYDALTGRLLETQTTKENKAPHTIVPVSSQPKTNGSVLDGFSKHATRHNVASNAVHHKAERSKTLMRAVVNKPTDNKVHAATGQNHQQHLATPQRGDKTPHRLNPLRELRAQNVNKSTSVSRFGTQTAHTSPVKATIIPIAQAPAELRTNQTVPSTRQAMVNPFQSAMDNSKSHEEPRLRKPSMSQQFADKLHISKKVLNIASTMAAVAILGGYFVYNNIPNLSMRVAATRSGVHGRLPSYKPAGFALNGPIQYQAGVVAINYKSNSDQRLFKLVQRTSDWNNETLLENFVASERRQYQTYQDKGKTIYIYEGSNATWVDEGVWYQIEGNSALNSDQLLRLAASL